MFPIGNIGQKWVNKKVKTILSYYNISANRFGRSGMRWPLTATEITKRNSVNKKILITKKVLLTYKKGLLTKKKDLLTRKKGLLTYTKQTHGKQLRQILTGKSYGKFPRQNAMANSCGKFSQQIAAANSCGK